MNIKVLIYSPSSNIWGGGQIYIEQLCNYMNESGMSASVLTSEPESFSCDTKRMNTTGAKLNRLTSTFKLAKIYKKHGFNTIILNDLASMWLAPIFRLYGYKTISLLHLYLQRKRENRLGHSNVEYLILKMSAYFSQRIFSVNKENQAVFGVKNVEFIGNYVPEWFIDVPNENKKKKYDFIIVARLAKQKNIPLFINLLVNLINKTGYQYTVLIVGDGPEKDNVHKLVDENKLNKNVDYLEWIDREKLPCIFDSGKCFVISSHHEGFATTLLEAHARGLPAIVTESAGFCAEFVKGYNAKTGLTFTPPELNEDVLYENIKILIDQHQSYSHDCIVKARIFSEKNVLGPILEAVINLNKASL